MKKTLICDSNMVVSDKVVNLLEIVSQLEADCDVSGLWVEGVEGAIELGLNGGGKRIMASACD